MHTSFTIESKNSDAIMSHDFTIVYIIYAYTCKYSFMDVNFRAVHTYTRSEAHVHYTN